MECVSIKDLRVLYSLTMGSELILHTPLRGLPTRQTDHMETLQKGYIQAVAAASGCQVSDITPDDGIDCMLTHRSENHTTFGDRRARLEVQLKTTSVPPKNGKISISVRRDRYQDYSAANRQVPAIVIIMHVPKEQSRWTSVEEQGLTVRHAAYWVNLQGAKCSSAARVTISAPITQVFDDVALCDMMERIGRGSKP